MVHDLSINEHRASGETVKSKLTRRIFLPLLTAAAASPTTAATGPPAQTKQAVSGSEAGSIWWNELRTRDALATRAFYASVIGWEPKVVAQNDMARPPAPAEKGYTVFTMRGQEVAGAEELESDDLVGMRPGWFTYVQVEDVDEAARKATQHGGKVVQQPVDVPTVGRMAEIEDPEGNRIGLVSPRA